MIRNEKIMLFLVKRGKIISLTCITKGRGVW